MGALPSRETQERGLYSHRHGRNRKTEMVLIPLTKTYFPSADCALFRSVCDSRRRRTAKYYYRALRPAAAAAESDYFCASSRWNAREDEFEGFLRGPPPARAAASTARTTTSRATRTHPRGSTTFWWWTTSTASLTPTRSCARPTYKS
ncbi:hypothetical protein STCU_11388 [Strigomonas culicis]|uniref:Uncharacterized protein n=1 Tax=Strigomonas culicis TaxID=28005 RepID=S9V0K7_9TRYP|nr:hypothetical protein STCU_11388 [Strigomonas culicis]|eukprot:EPY16335.1 hypothetical protein STCU_11388 [Strigomonas culicis]